MNKIKSKLLEKINETGKTLARLTKKKTEIKASTELQSNLSLDILLHSYWLLLELLIWQVEKETSLQILQELKRK